MNCRPSDLLHISGTVRRYCLDRAVWMFGSTLDSELERAIDSCKNEKEMERARNRVFDRWFPEHKMAPAIFKDPAALM